MPITTSSGVEGVEVWVDGGLTGSWRTLAAGTSQVPLQQDLAPGRTYTVRVRTCGVVRDEATVTTLPAPQGTAVVGRSHLLDLRAQTLIWTEPPIPPPVSILDELLGETQGFLIAPTAVDQDGLDLAVTLADRSSGRVRQDRCLAPRELASVPFADPSFELSANQLAVGPEGEELTFWELVLSGTFDDAGRLVHDLRLAALLDTRTLGGTGAGACLLLGSLVEATCVPCPDEAGGTGSCLVLDVTQERGEALDEVVLTLTPEPHGGCR